MIWQHWARLAFAGVMALSLVVSQGTISANASGNERALYLYYTHTGETARIVFKRDGQFVQSGLRQLNQFLRDWRRNEPANMDPNLFDLVWEVYQEVGATQPINIVSAYRSPQTNEMLRSAPGSGVAENSQHTHGKAMDFFIPGIDLATLRAVAMRHQVGGVGYYPTSGSPFVHLDTGNVRAWPRMTRTQLANVFPDGRTLHLPADGRPLSDDGRRYAEAQWNQCHRVPCSGDSGARTLFDTMSGGGSRTAVAELIAPDPLMRPASLNGSRPTSSEIASLDAPVVPFSMNGSVPLTMDDDAPTPATMSAALVQVARAGVPAGTGETAISAIASLEAPQPAARVLMSNPSLVAAYAPIQQDPEARRALDILIARETANNAAGQDDAPEPRVLNSSAIRTASLGNVPGAAPAASLFDATWTEVSNAGIDEDAARALRSMTRAELLPDVGMADVAFVAPDLDHIPETFIESAALSSARYGILFEAEGSLDPRAELGKHVARIGFQPEEFVGNSHLRFTREAPLISSGI